MASSRPVGMKGIVLLGLAAAVACGGTTLEETDGGAADGGGSDGSEADGSAPVDAGYPEGGYYEAGDSGRVPTYHRPDDSQCSQPAAAGDCMISGGATPCGSDSQCTSGTNGRCVESSGGAITCLCAYDTCRGDTDCPTGDLCACHGSPYTGHDGNTCIAGNCRVDSDCGSGGYCSPSHGTAGCGGLSGYYCHTAADTCLDDTDCTGASGDDVCAWSANDVHWECEPQELCP